MASNRDLSSPVPWRRSLRASQARRATRARLRTEIEQPGHGAGVGPLLAAAPDRLHGLGLRVIEVRRLPESDAPG